jgi:4-amino-4-deoxy-L-arabinose transferase-like glycosyltransferase
VRERVLDAAGPALALVAAVGLLLVASREGLGVAPDSVVYLDGARALAQGAGYVTGTAGPLRPITHFPPLYPALLAATSALGPALAAARILSIALRAVLLVVVWLGLTRVAGLGRLACALALGLIAVSPELTLAHATVYSEPLFLVTSVSGLFLLAAFLHRSKRGYLLAASVLLAAATLTRYVGISLLGAAGVLLVVWRGRPWKAVLTDVALFAATAGTPLALWYLRNLGANRQLGVSIADRTLALHLPTSQDWGQGAATLSQWLVPQAVPAILGVAAVLVGTGLLLAQAADRVRGGGQRAAGQAAPVCAVVFLASALCYLAFVAVARSLADALIPFDGRMLSAAYVLVVIGAVAACASEGVLRTNGRRAAVVLAALLIGLEARRAWRAAVQMPEGRRYAGPQYARMAREVAGLQSRAAFTNDPWFLVFAFERPVRPLPQRYDPFTQAPNPRYLDEVRGVCRDLVSTGGSVFWVRTGPRSRPWEARLGELMAIGHLHQVAQGTGWMVLAPLACD